MNHDLNTLATKTEIYDRDALRRQKRQEKIVNNLFDWINVGLIIIVLLICTYPLIYAFSASFSEPVQVTAGNLILLPKGFTLESYEAIFRNEGILRGYRNSIIIASAGTLLNLVLTILCAYPLSRRDLKGRNFFMVIVSFTMFFSGGIIPNFLLIQQLKLYNTWWSLLLPGAISTYNMIIMRTYFQNSIPDELEEAASIDGASNFQILRQIVLPLSRPVMAVIALYYLVGHWNAYFNALLYINNKQLYPLQLFLREILVLDETTLFQTTDVTSAVAKIQRAETIKYAVVIVSSIPMLILYPFLQRFFEKGVMIGALKG